MSVSVWTTGLSGSAKSTPAAALVPALESAGLAVTVLDGDAVR
jgi:adenylylsulfate kinase-like enzyme